MLQSIIGGNLSLTDLLLMFLSYAVVILVALPVHEMAHGFMADRLGDHTARACGRLTLNPFAHLDIFGTLMIILFGVGYARPVPVNPYHFRKPKAGMALTALAGPLSNFLMAAFAVGIFRVLVLFVNHMVILRIAGLFLVAFFAGVNLSLAVFNLLPIPPLDGFRIISLVLPDKWVDFVNRYQTYITFAVLLVVFSGILNRPIAYLVYYMEKAISFVFGFNPVIFSPTVYATDLFEVFFS